MAMMDEMVSQVAARTGLPEAQARQAAQAAIEFLDGRLPAPVGGNLRSLVSGEGGGGGGLGGALGGLGGMLGR